MKRILYLLSATIMVATGLYFTAAIVEAQSLNLNEHCQHHGRDRAVNVDGTAYGWKCEKNGRHYDVSIQSACEEQVGRNTRAEHNDMDDPYSWRCVGGNQDNDRNRNRNLPDIGHMSLGEYCQSQGYRRANNTNGNAHGWQCKDGNRNSGINMQHVCRTQFSNQYHADYSHFGNPNSWRCIKRGVDFESHNERVARIERERQQRQQQEERRQEQNRDQNRGSNRNGNHNRNNNSNNNRSDHDDDRQLNNNCAAGLRTNVGWGDRAMIAYDPPYKNNVRRNHNLNSQLLFQVAPGGKFDVTSHPVCEDGLWWVRINHDGDTGWTAIGNKSGSESWVVRVSSSNRDQCGPGWQPPYIGIEGEWAWIRATDFRIELQNRSIAAKDQLTLLATATWFDTVTDEVVQSTLEEIIKTKSTQLASEFSRSTELASQLQRMLAGTSVATARINYSRHRERHALLSNYDSDEFRCGNWVNVRSNIWDIGSAMNFPAWWQVWHEYLPYFAKSTTCERYNDTCGYLGISG